MKNDAKRCNLILKIVTIVVACFLALVGFSFVNNGSNKNKVSAAASHQLTIIIDDKVASAFINQEEMQFYEYIDEDENVITYATKNIVEDTVVDMQYTFVEEYELDEYFAHATSSLDQIFDGIVVNSFFMPHYDLTIEVKSKQHQYTVTVNKIMYLNKTQTAEPETEHIKIDPNTDFEYELQSPINYHLYYINSVCYDTDIENLEFSSELISAENISQDGEINIYFERDFYRLNIFYGSNNEASNKLGGYAYLLENDNIFTELDDNQNTVNYIYLNCTASVHFDVDTGYRFGKITVLDDENEEMGYELITDIDENRNFDIIDIYSNINVYVSFIETHDIKALVNKIFLDGDFVKIGKIAYENGTFSTNDIDNTLDVNSYVTYQTKIDDNFNRKYEFKKWIITDINGNDLSASDLNRLNITEQYNQQSKIYSVKISNLIIDLKIQACYDIKILNFTINWNTLNGTIETDILGIDYMYDIEFGNSITLTLTPNDEMRFLKKNELVGANEFVTENVVEELSLTEDDALNAKKIRISNITENLTLKVEFVVNTWWEHLLTYELRGKGTSAEPYLISDAMELSLVSYLINNKKVEKEGCIYYAEAYYKLTNNFDCGNEYYFVPIGTLKSQFNGIFDYNYCKISNIYTEKDVINYKYQGLFDVIGKNGKVINIDRSYLEYALYVLASLAVFGLIVYFVLLAEKIRTKPKKVVYLEGQEEKPEDLKEVDTPKNNKPKSRVFTKEEIMRMAKSKKNDNNKQ